MKKTLLSSLVLTATVVAGIANMGCTAITSASHASATASGEAWYVRSSTFTGRVRGIYYCPPESPTQCIGAELR